MEILENGCDFEKYVQCFYSFLGARNLNRSSERNTILRTVFGFDRHFTAEDLQNRLKQQKCHVSRSTLYATLRLLMDAGLVYKHRLPSRMTAQFEKFYCTDAHNHIYMEGSEEMMEFYDKRIEEIKTEMMEKYNVDIINHSFTIYCKKK